LRHAVTNADDISDANCDSHSYCYANCDGYSHSHCYGNSDSYSHSYSDGDGHTDSDIDAEDYANPTARPDTAASADAVMARGDW
jgi:hypothetical protein